MPTSDDDGQMKFEFDHVCCIGRADKDFLTFLAGLTDICHQQHIIEVRVEHGPTRFLTGPRYEPVTYNEKEPQFMR